MAVLQARIVGHFEAAGARYRVLRPTPQGADLMTLRSAAQAYFGTGKRRACASLVQTRVMTGMMTFIFRVSAPAGRTKENPAMLAHRGASLASSLGAVTSDHRRRRHHRHREDRGHHRRRRHRPDVPALH